MPVEREWKLELTADEALRIDAACGLPVRTVFQRNHYLDTPAGDFRARGHGLRLREERAGNEARRGRLSFGQVDSGVPASSAVARGRDVDNSKYFITLKGPTDPSKRFAERSEQEFSVGEETAREVLAGRSTPRSLGLDLDESWSALVDATLVPLGFIDNERRYYFLRFGQRSAAWDGAGSVFTLEVDTTEYPDGTSEQEVEVSWSDPERPVTEESLRAALAAIGVGWRLSAQGKFARFLERSGRLRT